MRKKYIFLNPYQYYNENPEIILNYIKDIYILNQTLNIPIYMRQKKEQKLCL